MKRLLLVRHGETEWNADRRLQGQTDIGLSVRGRAQARALAPLLAGLRPDTAVTSDLSRAAETAKILGIAAHPDIRLREQHLGTWTGRAIADIRAVADEEYHAWRAGQFVPEGAESWTEFRSRVAAALGDGRGMGQTVLIVCHGGVIRAALEATLGLPPSRIIPVAPASLTVLAYPDGHARLEAFNVRGGDLEVDAPD